MVIKILRLFYDVSFIPVVCINKYLDTFNYRFWSSPILSRGKVFRVSDGTFLLSSCYGCADCCLVCSCLYLGCIGCCTKSMLMMMSRKSEEWVVRLLVGGRVSEPDTHE